MTLSAKGVLTRGLIGALLVMAMPLAGAGLSRADAAGAAWAVQSVASPSNFRTSQNTECVDEEVEACDQYMVTVTNVGTGPSQGPLLITDTLPPGMVTKMLRAEQASSHSQLPCSPPSPATMFTCETSEPVPPGGVVQILVAIRIVEGVQATAANHVEVQEVGSGLAPVTTTPLTSVPNTVNGVEPLFGPRDFTVVPFGRAGGADTFAGDHPASVNVSVNWTTRPNPAGGGLPVEEPRSSIVDLPLGFVGNPLAAAQCPESTLYGKGQPRSCPAASRVGVVAIQNHLTNQMFPIYNIVPEPGYAATFAFEIAETNVLLPVRVLPSRQGYVLSVAVPAIPRTNNVQITGLAFTLFGTPGSQSGSGSALALFTNPVDCGAAPLSARLEMDSWVKPDRWVSAETPVYETADAHAVVGCEALQFDPALETSAEGGEADSPTGLSLHVGIPQAPLIESVQATPDLRDLEVTLPEGMTVSPGAADGLRACAASGPEGINLGNGDNAGHEVEEGEELGEDGMPHAAPGHCPAASQIGTVEAVTPVLATPLSGHVYLAEPQCGGSCSEADAQEGKAFRLYVELAGSGIIVKLAGTASANPATGRLTVKFDDAPQFPVSDLEVHMNGGPRAPLSTPRACGAAHTTSVLTPWSAPQSGPAATPATSFEVGGCLAQSAFAPSVLAQADVPQAAAHPAFTFALNRHDREQNLTGATIDLPLGLLGSVSGVAQCSNAAAAAGTCSPASAIGTVTAGIGAGSQPFWITGEVYLTGPYQGAPFGLAIVLPTKAGPFTFAGNTGNGVEVVRAGIHIDPRTAAISIQSDPLPTIIDGVPLRLRTVNVTVNRPGFMINPTSCRQQTVGVQVDGSDGGRESVNRPFAIAGCAGLPFTPSFRVSTQAQTSKKNGASLDVTVGYPQGAQANIRSVAVTLPKALPSRLTTIQQACPQATFAANPASCPAGSNIGIATAHTPVLANPVTGPAYLVSHGGAAFPDLVLILQGEGVKLELIGSINIKKQITSSAFNTVPDAPISSFELKLPEGPHSGLAAVLPPKAKGNLCGTSLVMPTTMTGQNGAVIKQNTKIAVTGCAKVKRKAAHRARGKRGTRARKAKGRKG